MASAQPTTAKRAQVQAAVLAATEELLAASGSFQDLKIERIATSAGISRTAFYFYFKDKRELLVRLTEEVTTELYDQADVWFSGQGDAREEIMQALSRVAQLYGLQEGEGDKLAQLDTSAGAAVWMARIDARVAEVMKEWDL